MGELLSNFLENSSGYAFRLQHLVKEEPIGNVRRNMNCPHPRSGHRSVFYNGNLYVVGGFTPQHPDSDDFVPHIFQEVWKFNNATKTWILLDIDGDTPSQLASHAAALHHNKMLVYGGTCLPFGEHLSNDAYECNLDSLIMRKIETSGEKPPPLYGQAIAVYENKLYSVGGTSGLEFFLAVHCLDLRTLEWTKLDKQWQTCLPEPRYRHEIVIFKNNIYVLGGGSIEETYDVIDIPVFNLKENKWHFCEAKSNEAQPPPKKCHGCVHVNNDVYIVGGHDGIDSHSDIWKLDLVNLIWTQLDVNLPVPLLFHSVSLSEEGQLFIFGGLDKSLVGERNNDLYTMWLKVPSLLQMSWQAVAHYNPQIGAKDKLALVAAGIPNWLLDEIEFEAPRS